MRIRLLEKRPETADVISFLFDLGGQALPYVPGQYLFYTLDKLDFSDDRGKQRHFTISSSPTEQGIVMFTTRMRGSGFKETLRHAEPGYELACGTPAGSFVLPEGEGMRHIFLAGGIGITPYRSMVRYAADKKIPLDAVLFTFNHSSADIVFREELDSISRQIPTFKPVHVLTSPGPDWTGERGRLDENLLRKYAGDLSSCLFWLSGPPAMVTADEPLLQQIGIPREAVHVDRFVGY